MKTISKQEYNDAIDSGRLKLYMYDIVVDEHDTTNSYYKISCIGSEVHLHPIEKPTVEVGEYEIKKNKEY